MYRDPTTMRYAIKVLKDGVVSSFEAEIRATRISAILNEARGILMDRGASEVLLSVTPVPKSKHATRGVKLCRS